MSPRFLYRIRLKPAAAAALLLAVAAFSCLGQRNPDAVVRWETDINTAVRRAEAEQRPVFLHFTGNDCLPAAQMFSEVFGNADIAAKLNTGYVMVSINASENPALAKQYTVSAIPADLIMHPNGQVIHRRQGKITADLFKNYLAFLDNLVQADKGTAALPNSPVTTPANGQGTAPVSDTLRDPFTHQPVASPNTMPNSVPNSVPNSAVPPAAAYQPIPVTPAAETVSTSVVPAVPAAPVASAAPVLNPPPAVSYPPSYPSSNPASNPVSNPAVHNPLRTTEIPTRYFPEQKSPPEQPPVSPVPPKVPVNARVAAAAAAEREVRETRDMRETLRDRRNEPAAGTMTVEVPLALDGFCPVTLVKKVCWEPGNPAYSTMYKGAVFRFVSEEAIEEFVKNPAVYAPVAMGEDVVLLIDRNKRVNGSRTFGVTFNGRVFLFSSRETLQAFWEKAEFYAEIALKYETAKKDPPSRTIY